jgi:ribose-phosphate pyrophosphokinase
MASVTRNTVKVIASNAHPGLAEDLARELAVPLVSGDVGSFADGETRVHVSEDARGAAVFLVQPTCPPVNEHLMVLALLADAVRAAGATRVVGIVPYMAYAWQEQRSQSSDHRSAQVVARLLGCVGIDHLVTLDLHTPALESALPMPATLLHAEELFLPRIKDWGVKYLVVVAPDAGGLKRAQRYAQALGTPLAAIAKDRPRPDAAAPLQVLGDVANRAYLIVDDMASTGGTLSGAAAAPRHAGAREIHALFTHAVMAPGAMDRLRAAHFGKLLTTSIPVSADPSLEIFPVAPPIGPDGALPLRRPGGGRVGMDGTQGINLALLTGERTWPHRCGFEGCCSCGESRLRSCTTPRCTPARRWLSESTLAATAWPRSLSSWPMAGRWS